MRCHVSSLFFFFFFAKPAQVLFIGLGITISYFFVFGLSFTFGSITWRLPIAAQCIPAICICFIVFFVPESPRWLIKQGRVGETTHILGYVFSLAEDDPYVVAEKTSMMSTVALEERDPFVWSNILKPDAVKTNRRLALSFLVLFMNQVRLYTRPEPIQS